MVPGGFEVMSYTTRCCELFPAGSSMKFAGSTASYTTSLNGPRRLRGDVVYDAVDPANFIDDPAGNSSQHLVWQRHPVGGHAVFGMDGADSAGVGISAVIAHDADGHYRQQHRERLPDLVVESRGLDLR